MSVDSIPVVHRWEIAKIYHEQAYTSPVDFKTAEIIGTSFNMSAFDVLECAKEFPKSSPRPQS